MKLLVDYNTSKAGFDLKMDLQIEIEQDAEALGYITNVLFQAANVLAQKMKEANPVFHPRISLGVAKSESERVREQNNVYPFTTFIVEDE